MKNYYVLIGLLFSIATYGQEVVVVFQETFETGSAFIPSETCADDPPGYDYFTRTTSGSGSGLSDGTKIRNKNVYRNPEGSYFWAAQDTDGSPCTMDVETLEKTGIDIDITGRATSLDLVLLAAEDDQDNPTDQKWDHDTLVFVEVKVAGVNGGRYTKVLQFAAGADSSSDNMEPKLDTDFDGTGDGTAITDTFQEFRANIDLTGATGATLDLKITFYNLNGSGKDFAIDNVRIIQNFAAVSGTATISDLSLSAGNLSPTFASGTTSYTASVANSVTSLTLLATTTDGNASVTVNGISVTSGQLSTAIPLMVGSNMISIDVTAQDGTIQTYTVTVTRAVSPDTSAPVIILNGDAAISIELGASYTDAGAIATDNIDGDISANILVTGSVDTSMEGVYTITYNVTDTAGHAAAEVIRTVTVMPSGLNAENIKQLNQTIMPHITQVAIASTAAAIEHRIGSAASEVPQMASYQLDGYPLRLNDESTLADKLAGGLLQKLSGYIGSLEDGLDWQRMLANTSFALPLKADGDNDRDSSLTLWGSGDYSKLVNDSKQGQNWKGDVTSVQLGIDTRRDALLFGGLVAWSQGDVDYTLDGDKGNYNHQMTSIHPYLAWTSDAINLWASAGYGRGELEIEQDDDEQRSTDTDQLSLAAGIKGQLMRPGLNLKSDILLVRTNIDKSADANIVGQRISSQRLRLLLELDEEYHLASGSVFKHMIEVGARYDGGDGDTGVGAVLGAGVGYMNPISGLTVEGNIHALVGRDDYTEWGVSGLISLDPGTDQLGLAFSLRPSYGYSGSRADSVWQGIPQGDAARTADAQMVIVTSYGLPAAPDGGLLTPYSKATFGNNANIYRLGIRWQSEAWLDVNLYGERRESSSDLAFDSRAVHAILLEGRVQF